MPHSPLLLQVCCGKGVYFSLFFFPHMDWHSKLSWKKNPTIFQYLIVAYCFVCVLSTRKHWCRGGMLTTCLILITTALRGISMCIILTYLQQAQILWWQTNSLGCKLCLFPLCQKENADLQNTRTWKKVLKVGQAQRDKHNSSNF